MPDADLRVYIVWSNIFPADDPAAAKRASATFSDPRVHQFHDPDRLAARAFAPRVGMPTVRKLAALQNTPIDEMQGRFAESYVSDEAALFDSMFFFPPGAVWAAQPPADAGWVTQLDASTFQLDVERFFWGEALGDEMARIARELMSASTAPPPAIEGRRIWDGAPHCAFGDLVRFGDRFYATHREADSHQGTDGVVRVISSADGDAWKSVVLIAEAGIDLRDPKLSVTPAGELLLTCGGVDYSDGLVERHTRAALSRDGAAFGPLQRVQGIPTSNWFFRLAWHDGVGYCMPNLWDQDPATGKLDSDTRRIALYRTRDGLRYEPVAAELGLPNGACEASLAFEPDGGMVAVLRDALDAKRSFLLRSSPPYTAFEHVELAHGLGGPHLVRLPSGALLVGTREWPHDRVDGVDDYATVLLRIAPDGALERLALLRSGGDTGYPALVMHAGQLWMQYYSSHGDGTAIYLARVPVELVR